MSCVTDYDLYSEFDIEKHKANFVHYLEIVILPNGHVEYAVPSHQEKIIEHVMRTKGWTRDDVKNNTPPEFYFDWLTWLSRISGVIAVWEHQWLGDKLTGEQKLKLRQLKNRGLYLGEI